MQYLLMIYGDEAAMGSATPEQGKAMGEAYARFTQDIVKGFVIILAVSLTIDRSKYLFIK